MSRFRRFLAMSFRAKVLVPVIFVMVCLLVVTALVVHWRINKQFENEASKTLHHANDGFSQWHQQCGGNWIVRMKTLREDKRFQDNSKGDKIVREKLSDILNIAGPGVDLVSFTTTNKELFGPANNTDKIPKAEFESAIAPAVEQAMQGVPDPEIIRVGDKIYDIVSFPVHNGNGDVSGAFTLGSEIGRTEAEEISHFTHSDIVLLSGNHVVAQTLSTTDANRRFVNLFKDLSLGLRSADSPFEMKKEIFDGTHYYCAAGRFIPNAANSPGYLLLCSYEDSWRALQTTQEILFIANAIAIVLGSLIVCFLVGMVTRPLRELRDTVEAVGRGDFSRRVKVRYDDECGELARSFNRMTENLKHSREQLESTVETLKNTQAQLIQSEKLSGIGEFIAGVAHELNNPLTSVMGFSELLQNASVAPAEKRYLEMIHKCALRCQKIVQALLGFARRSTPERKAVCVNQLVEAAVEILFYQLRTSNVEAILDLDPDLPHAMVDPHQIQQVFVNLLNNARQAIEAHQPKGWIKVITAKNDGYVRVIIQDNGPGISEQNLSKIFDPFFTTKEVGKGTGLGLSLVYGIIREHGGSIVPRSRPGEGATFIIELPVTAKPAEVAAAETPDPVIHLGKGREGVGKRILVIDDEEPILQMVREALTPQGYEVDLAPDGATALRCIAEKKYDVALCDWKMPGLNGQQVYERARAVNPALSDRIIFITGDIINERTRKFLEQQNKICLPKPFTIAEFRLAIKKVLSAE